MVVAAICHEDLFMLLLVLFSKHLSSKLFYFSLCHGAGSFKSQSKFLLGFYIHFHICIERILFNQICINLICTS